VISADLLQFINSLYVRSKNELFRKFILKFLCSFIFMKEASQISYETLMEVIGLFDISL
jgi:hypothetical protein